MSSLFLTLTILTDMKKDINKKIQLEKKQHVLAKTRIWFLIFCFFVNLECPLSRYIRTTFVLRWNTFFTSFSTMFSEKISTIFGGSMSVHFISCRLYIRDFSAVCIIFCGLRKIKLLIYFNISPFYLLLFYCKTNIFPAFWPNFILFLLLYYWNL